jgi:hypothetical protein
VHFDLDLSIEMLGRSPATLRALLDGLGEPWVRGTEGPETFSPFDVVGHLIDGEETDWIPRARIILARGPDLRFEPYDRFRHRARNAGRSLEWSHSKGQEIFRLTRAVRDSDDVLVCRLVGHKITCVHRRLWPALVRLADAFTRDDLAALHEIHTSGGRHELRVVPFPRWVSPTVRRQARKLTELEARAALGDVWATRRKRRSLTSA